MQCIVLQCTSLSLLLPTESAFHFVAMCFRYGGSSAFSHFEIPKERPVRVKYLGMLFISYRCGYHGFNKL
jgi:hypothetical protein